MIFFLMWWRWASINSTEGALTHFRYQESAKDLNSAESQSQRTWTPFTTLFLWLFLTTNQLTADVSHHYLFKMATLNHRHCTQKVNAKITILATTFCVEVDQMQCHCSCPFLFFFAVIDTWGFVYWSSGCVELQRFLFVCLDSLWTHRGPSTAMIKTCARRSLQAWMEPVSNTLRRAVGRRDVCVCASVYVLTRGLNIAIILTERPNEWVCKNRESVCACMCVKSVIRMCQNCLRPHWLYTMINSGVNRKEEETHTHTHATRCFNYQCLSPLYQRVYTPSEAAQQSPQREEARKNRRAWEKERSRPTQTLINEW